MVIARHAGPRALPPVFVLSTQPAIVAVVKIASDGAGEVGAVRSVPELGSLAGLLAGEREPIVVVDVDDTEMGLGDLVRAVRTLTPDARVVVLSSDATGAAVLDALRSGVRAFVRKPDGLRAFGDVVARVAHDEIVLPLDLQRDAVEELGRMVRRARQGSGVDALLSPREHQILDQLAEGLTTRQIGSRLSISPRTVEGHTRGIYRKLAVTTRVQALARAAAMGLVDPG